MRTTDVLILVAMLTIVILGSGCMSANPSCTERVIVVTQTPTISSSNIEHLEISPSGLDNAKVGYTVQFTATAYDKNNNYLPQTAVKWRIARGGSIATINSRGVLTPEGTGEVEVTASAGGKSATAYITVKRAHVVERYKSYREDNRYYYDHDYRDERHSNLPPGHCYYRDDVLERITAEEVPCNR